MKWETVIGLEVHVQVKTKTKIFCSCRNEFGAEPNSNVCPVCLGLPGVLPVFNEKVLEAAVKAGLGLNCEIARYTKFDRKNYFYPDLPKAYQISQYDMPICVNGYIEIESEGKAKRVGVTRIHMEEDAGKLMHGGRESLVDYNRTGVPLLEIVSEPDMRTPEEAYAYLLTLKQIIQYLGVSDCDMEKGSLRCDANISVRKRGDAQFGTKTEIKNLNSFKAVRSALEFEISRHIKVIESGGKITQETRLWDSNKQITVSMRSKEDAHDYRYFPEPDLLPIIVEDSYIEGIRSLIPELPKERINRMLMEYKITGYDAKVLCQEKALADMYEECARFAKDKKKLANMIITIFLRELNERQASVSDVALKAQDLGRLCDMWSEGRVNNIAVQTAIKESMETGKSPIDVVKEKGLIQVQDSGRLEDFAKQAIEANPKVVKDYKSGKKNAVMFLVGQVMKASKGKANPQKVKEILENLLS